MNNLFETTITFHTAFLGILLILAVINYFLINDRLSYDMLVKRVRTILPIYYGFLAAIIFTGLVLLGISKFSINPAVALMIIVWFVILMMAIRGYKKFKLLGPSNKSGIDSFIRFAKRKYLIDAILILTTMAIAYMLKAIN